MNDKQIKKMCSGILISDVISYVNTHQNKYKKFIEDEKKESEENKNELHKNKSQKNTTNKNK